MDVFRKESKKRGFRVVFVSLLVFVDAKKSEVHDAAVPRVVKLGRLEFLGSRRAG